MNNVDVQNFRILCEQIQNNINRVMIGKQNVVDLLLIALTSGGHVLIEDVPGIGKTTLVSALAKSLSLSFKRIQFTPDLMPSDITGFNLYNQKTGEFEFQPGSVMSQIVLADEINRTSPKTQSSLLEVMQENQVTVDGVTYPVPQPFIVLATQNPVDHVGTYPLPEAQLDRFMLKIDLGYPSVSEEVEILELYANDSDIPELDPIAGSNDVIWMRNQAQMVHCAKSVMAYISELTAATRRHPDIKLGASPRASRMLMQAAKSRALLMGRDYVRPDDVQALAVNVLSHRITLNPESRLKRISSDDVIYSVLKQVSVPER